jgi:hypothetical protein
MSWGFKKRMRSVGFFDTLKRVEVQGVSITEDHGDKIMVTGSLCHWTINADVFGTNLSHTGNF